MHYSYEIIFSFESGKQYKIKEEQLRGTRLESTIDFSSQGDPFYLVVYDDRPDEPVLIYSARSYRFDT